MRFIGKKLNISLGILKLNNVKIGWKYGIIFTISMLLFAISTVVVYMQMENVRDAIDAQERRGDRVTAFTEMGSLFRSMDIYVANYLLYRGGENVVFYEKELEKLNALEAEVRPQLDTDKQVDLLNKIVENVEKYNDLFMNSMVGDMDRGNIAKYIADRTLIQTETFFIFDQLIEMVNKERASAVAASKSAISQSVLTLIIAIAISAIVGGILLFTINRILKNNLRKVVFIANEVSQGNLQVDSVAYKGNDEIGQLANSINLMKDNLRDIIQRVAAATDTVSSQSEELTQASNEVKEGSQQIAATMQELSTGAELQANHSSNLSQMMDEYTEKIHQAYSNGRMVSDSSSSVLNMTENGSELMKKSVEQMTAIDSIVKDAAKKVKGLDEQLKEVTKLVQVVQDIAEQTNLLSLNAAIEAARAGEHGKGFAVVANEVRKLAEQVSHSVVDITTIVDNIQSESETVAHSLQNGYDEVDAGSKQIQVMGETFEQINLSISGMVTQILEISSLLKDITDSSEKMNSSIQEIASVSEESAASVEQAAASVQQSSSTMVEISSSANGLATLAEELTGQVRKFKL